MTPGDETSRHGSLQEEASRLFEALQAWAEGQQGAGTHGDAAARAPECRVCPLCRTLGTLREARPEVFEHLATAVSALSAAVADLVVAHEREWSSRRAPDIERIDIT